LIRFAPPMETSAGAACSAGRCPDAPPSAGGRVHWQSTYSTSADDSRTIMGFGYADAWFLPPSPRGLKWMAASSHSPCRLTRSQLTRIRSACSLAFVSSSVCLPPDRACATVPAPCTGRSLARISYGAARGSWRGYAGRRSTVLLHVTAFTRHSSKRPAARRAARALTGDLTPLTRCPLDSHVLAPWASENFVLRPRS